MENTWPILAGYRRFIYAVTSGIRDLRWGIFESYLHVDWNGDSWIFFEEFMWTGWKLANDWAGHFCGVEGQVGSWEDLTWKKPFWFIRVCAVSSAVLNFPLRNGIPCPFLARLVRSKGSLSVVEAFSSIAISSMLTRKQEGNEGGSARTILDKR